MFAALTDNGGKFSRSLIPGVYYVYAARTTVESQALADPVYRALHRSDLPAIVVAEGNNSAITLTLK